MINITLTEHSVFTVIKDTATIRIHDHEDGRYTGKVQEGIGQITFYDKEQADQFRDMINLMWEKNDE